MTAERLEQIYYLKGEIQDLQRRIITAESGKASALYSGSEYIAYLKRQIAKCQQEYTELETYISQCDDDLMHYMLVCRFVKRMPWVRVSFEIGGGNTAENCCKKVSRYLKAN